LIYRTPNVSINLRDYGILVPLLKDRADRVLEELKKNPNLNARIHEWYQEEAASPLSRENVLKAHDESYVEGLLGKFPAKHIEAAYELIDEEGNPHRYDPSSAVQPFSHLVSQARLGAGGTLQAMERSLDRGFCFYLNSYAGAHHAMSFGGRGFCILNDIVIGIKALLEAGKIQQAWVIDIDAHKGDGTAELTRDDSRINTLSIHMEKGWPLDGDKRDDNHKPFPWYINSDVDIPIAESGEATYLECLKNGLNQLGELSEPDLVVVVDGSDAYEKDALPGTSLLKLSQDEMLKRDILVYEFLQKRDISQTWLMAGGYGEDVYVIYLQFLEWLLEKHLV